MELGRNKEIKEKKLQIVGSTIKVDVMSFMRWRNSGKSKLVVENMAKMLTSACLLHPCKYVEVWGMGLELEEVQKRKI